MLQLHPEILKRDGKEQFAVLPYEEFLAVQELIEDLDVTLTAGQSKTGVLLEI